MNSPQLRNYLRANRKRLALSQDDVAYLLGVESGAKICRYERFIREPSLQTALAFEVVFQRPVRELFAGLYRKIEKEVLVRAKKLSRRADHGKFKAQMARKQKSLAALTAGEFDNSPKTK